MGNREPLRREDYEEPRCLLDLTPPEQRRPAGTVPVQRVIEKLDEYTARRSYGAAKRHLDDWLAEARALGDRRGEFTLLNEQMGFFRKQNRRAKAVESAEAALALLDAVGADSLAAGTCYVNAGTVYDHFQEPERALDLFARARTIYEAALEPKDPRLGALYNNMGLALAALRRFDEARALFRRALEVMGDAPIDQAITWLNTADALAAEQGEVEAEEEIQSCLESAAACLDDPAAPRDSYYAFVCSKCAPGFDHYGWFAYAGELKERCEAIYGRT